MLYCVLLSPYPAFASQYIPPCLSLTPTADTQRWRLAIKEELELAYSARHQTASSAGGVKRGGFPQLITDIEQRCAWIGDSYCYHKCVGLISAMGHLSIWDFGEVYTLNRSTVNYVGAVQSICVTPYAAPMCGEIPQSVVWEHKVVIPLHEWVDILPSEPPFATTSTISTPAVPDYKTVSTNAPDAPYPMHLRPEEQEMQPPYKPSGGNSLLESEQRAVISQIFAPPSHAKLALERTLRVPEDKAYSPMQCDQILQQYTLDNNYFGAHEAPTSTTRGRGPDAAPLRFAPSICNSHHQLTAALLLCYLWP